MSTTRLESSFPPRRLLLGPGPSDVSPRVLAALARPLVGHLDPSFLRLMDETQSMLRQVFKTENRLTFAVSGTGSAGMEACVVNLIEPGDKMIVCVNGVFGARMADVARRAGAQVTTLERPWGETFPFAMLEDALATVRPKALGIVHAETSTGALQDVNGLGALCHQYGAMLLLDTVTSLGGLPVEIDAWEVDAVYSGTQKCLSCPPGLAPVSFSPRALDVITKRKQPPQSWYLDAGMLANYWGQDRTYHHTAPISMNYALREALAEILEEGLPPRFARHQLNHRALKAGLAAMGISFTAAEGKQLPTLNAVRVPARVDDAAVRTALLNEEGIEIGGGLGDFKGKAWRIGLMGQSSRKANVVSLLAALERLLARQGYSLTAGASLAAANQIYAEAID